MGLFCHGAGPYYPGCLDITISIRVLALIFHWAVLCLSMPSLLSLRSANVKRREEGNFEVLLHSDAAQAVGKIPVDVNDLGVDYLTVAGHKFYGPRIGALYRRANCPLSPVGTVCGQQHIYITHWIFECILIHFKNLDAPWLTLQIHIKVDIKWFPLPPGLACFLTGLCRRRTRVWMSGRNGERSDDRRVGRRRRFDFLVVGGRGRGGGRGISAEEDEGQARSKYRGTDCTCVVCHETTV